MSLEQWALPQLAELLPLDNNELRQLLAYTITLPDEQASQHLGGILGESSQALHFTRAFIDRRAYSTATDNLSDKDGTLPPLSHSKPTVANDGNKPAFDTGTRVNLAQSATDQHNGNSSANAQPPRYAPPNPVIEAARERARDEQDMQQMLQNLQYQFRIYNSEIEPDHDSDYFCNCPIHQYQARKRMRYGVQERWSRAVMYPGEKHYDDNKYTAALFSRNPYRYQVMSPFGYFQGTMGPTIPQPSAHARFLHSTIDLNNSLNRKAQSQIDAQEPKHSIWQEDPLAAVMANMSVGNGDKKRLSTTDSGDKPSEKNGLAGRRASSPASRHNSAEASRPPNPSRFSSFKKSLGIKSSEEKTAIKAQKVTVKSNALRDDILAEEQGRWPDEEWRQLVSDYQEKVGMTAKIAELRARQPIQYSHLLRAGYFEPIPVAWATQASNPLKFSIEAAAGWRGLTPAWRGYEDTAEERLYWVLNHREGSVGMRMKPDFISEMTMARDRMASAVEPPPLYFDAADTCHLQHTSKGYSKQVMPPPFKAYDRPEQPTDDTMILLDVSGSMDFDAVRPNYDQYLITGYSKSTQPKNRDVAKAIVRRFTDAMANHDHSSAGYDMTTFANSSRYIGTINHRNFEHMWQNVKFGGGTRVMTGWQRVKELHFQKHSESATLHPVYGWQAGPQTPILRLLLLLDGEATDMDEFELDLLGCSWAHVTIFLIGVDGCPHHHRHANELQRISDVNHHVAFVDAQGNCPERFVTHELLKRHLGYDISMQEFEQMESPPAYDG